MSGVMIKTGIYGLLRMLAFLGPPPAWWGWTLLGIGFASGTVGVLFALAQHDLKRLLAYHSVENIGIIALGMGVGLLGLNANSPVIAALGFAGALLHVINHALFKGLLFLCAGAVQHGAHTLHIEELGGLQRRMPRTAILFLLGAAAISGLPPLNGFVSEFLIYLGAYRGVGSLDANGAASMAAVIGGLALIGGLATACFTKAYGIVFLGLPRSREAAQAHEAGPLMLVSMALLAAACVLIAVLAPVIIPLFAPAVSQITRFDVSPVLAGAMPSLRAITFGAGGLMLLIGLLAILRRRLLSRRIVSRAVTWDCAYEAPNPRMQYTASSFAEPLTKLFDFILRPHRKAHLPMGLFPDSASFSEETPDAARRILFHPAYAAVEWCALRMRWLQNGRVQIYVVYIMLTLLAVLVATMGR